MARIRRWQQKNWLALTGIFLDANGYHLVPVLWSIRFAVGIADPNTEKPVELDEIAHWLKQHSSRSRQMAYPRTRIHMWSLMAFVFIGMMVATKYTSKKLDYWMVFDIDLGLKKN